MQLDIPDNIYNWINDFFHEHSHSTKFAGECSTVAEVKASVIQGSGIGPAAYIVTAADLHLITTGNCIFKYADDTYLVVPAINTGSRSDEIFHIEAWAGDNNLQLNRAKSKEIVITARRQRGKLAQLPPPVLNIERVSSHRILGVIVNDRLTAIDHVTNLLTSCSSLLYAMRVLCNHGIPVASLHEVFRAIVLSKVMYCSPAMGLFGC